MSSRSFGRSSSRITNLLSRRSVLWVSAFSVALGLASPSVGAQSAAPPQVTYTFTDLGTLPGGQAGGSYGYAINASGDVAGYSATSTGSDAVIFKQGKIIDLGLVPGATGSAAYGINGYDAVTGGLYFPASGFNHAFLYSAGKMKDLGTAPGFDSSIGNSINDSGQIAGESFSNGSTNNTTFLYSAGKFTNIPGFYAFNEGNQIGGNRINASGQIIGNVPNTPGVGAIYTDGSIQLLSTERYSGLISSAINDSAWVTGYRYYLESHTNAFLYENGGYINLGSPQPGGDYSVGEGINAAGQVVGNFLDLGASPQGNYAFLYTPGQGIVKLDSLLPAGSKWQLLDAKAINDKGQITGAAAYYTNPYGFGTLHAYLLSPVFVPFSTLDAVMEIAGTPRTDFAAGGRVTLGAKSNGFNPLTETVVLQLGGYHISIPPSSFVKTNDYYIYQGTIGTVAVQAILRPLNARVFLFGIVGHGAAAASLPIAYPVALTLTIGDDTGTEQITSGYPGGMPTPAQVCAAFGIPCD